MGALESLSLSFRAQHEEKETLLAAVAHYCGPPHAGPGELRDDDC